MYVANKEELITKIQSKFYPNERDGENPGVKKKMPASLRNLSRDLL